MSKQDQSKTQSEPSKRTTPPSIEDIRSAYNIGKLFIQGQVPTESQYEFLKEMKTYDCMGIVLDKLDIARAALRRGGWKTILKEIES